MAVDVWQTDYGLILLTPWLTLRAASLRLAQTTGVPDWRFKRAKKFRNRMRRLAEKRFMAEVV